MFSLGITIMCQKEEVYTGPCQSKSEKLKGIKFTCKSFLGRGRMKGRQASAIMYVYRKTIQYIERGGRRRLARLSTLSVGELYGKINTLSELWTFVHNVHFCINIQNTKHKQGMHSTKSGSFQKKLIFNMHIDSITFRSYNKSTLTISSL